ncbi:MAG: hypothetical protein MRJ65_14610 [Candidatus Brocadiaceae bacterium]|nr:hypothetical protein [Candidatus Brocadiaceae bacterium]
MPLFKNLFGTESSTIKKTCVVVPFLPKGLLKKLGIETLKRGTLYSTANTDTFTFIKAGIGTLLVGDAVLYLEQTQCKNIIYFGSCGLVRETDRLTLGSLVCPEKCFSFESFTDVITGQMCNVSTQYPGYNLLQTFLDMSTSRNIRSVTGISIGSLKCEESYKKFFLEKGVEVIDMECSAFFSAAHSIQKDALAILYATDIITQKPLFTPLEPESRLLIDNAIHTACKVIRLFCTRQ